MKNSILAIVSILFALSTTAAFAEGGVSRAEVFDYLWSTIERPVYDTNETQFIDVADDSPYYKVLRYAKKRGVLDDTEYFYPTTTASYLDVYVWLVRTRNIASIDQLTLEDMPSIIAAYPPLQKYDPNTSLDSEATLQELTADFDAYLASEIHEISFYSEKFHGKGTAFGDTFDMKDYTAAHPSFPYNTLVRVTNVHSDASVIVRVNDRGPFVPDRSMDLSLAAFLAITDRASGIATVTIERLGDYEMTPEAKEYYEYIDANYVPFNNEGDPDIPLVVTHTIVPQALADEVVIDETSTNETDTNEAGTDEGTPSLQEQESETEIVPEATVTQQCSRFEEYYQKRLSSTIHFYRGVPHKLQLGKSITLQSTDYFVVRSVFTPSGERITEQWIDPRDEKFSFAPTEIGEYSLYIQTGSGKSRRFSFEVISCT